MTSKREAIKMADEKVMAKTELNEQDLKSINAYLSNGMFQMDGKAAVNLTRLIGKITVILAGMAKPEPVTAEPEKG